MSRELLRKIRQNSGKAINGCYNKPVHEFTDDVFLHPMAAYLKGVCDGVNAMNILIIGFEEDLK